MINLLPPEAKEEALYGRRNRRLVFVAVGIFGVMFAMAALTVFGQFYLSRSEKQYINSGQVVEQRIKDQKLEDSQKGLETLSSNFKTASQILSKQILFSRLLPKFAEIIPKGAYVKQISIDDNDTFLQFDIAAQSREVANQAYINVSDPKNGLFDKADLLEIACTEAGLKNQTQTENAPPCRATVKALFKSTSPYLLLNYLKTQEATKQ